MMAAATTALAVLAAKLDLAWNWNWSQTTMVLSQASKPT